MCQASREWSGLDSGSREGSDLKTRDTDGHDSHSHNTTRAGRVREICKFYRVGVFFQFYKISIVYFNFSQ